MSARNRSFADMASQKLHPCFGYPLHRVSKWVALLNMLFSTSTFILILGMQILFVSIFQELEERIFKVERESTGYGILVSGSAIFVIFVFLVFMALCFASVYLNYVLYKGVKENDIGKVRLWLAVAVAYLFLTSIGCISLSILISKFALVIVFEVLEFIYLSYGIWIVYEFSKEIKQPSDNGNSYNYNEIGRIPI